VAEDALDGAEKTARELGMGIIAVAANLLPRNNNRIRVSAVLHFPTNRRRDITNYEATLWKLVNDALVDLKVVPDDTAKFIRNGLVDMVVDKSRGAKTTLYVEVMG
jgi:hypothetical protein